MRWFLPLLLLLTSCAQNKRPTIYGESTAFSETIIPYAMEVAHDHHLRFEDTRVYYHNATAERVMIIFTMQAAMEVCEARFLLVDVVEGLLEQLNSDPRIVDAFDHQPITAYDLEIYFNVESFYVEYVDPTYMAWVSLHDGIVRFYDGIIKDWHKDFWHARVEPYWKSLEFVEIMRGAEELIKAKEKLQVKKEELKVREL